MTTAKKVSFGAFGRRPWRAKREWRRAGVEKLSSQRPHVAFAAFDMLSAPSLERLARASYPSNVEGQMACQT